MRILFCVFADAGIPLPCSTSSTLFPLFLSTVVFPQSLPMRQIDSELPRSNASFFFLLSSFVFLVRLTFLLLETRFSFPYFRVRSYLSPFVCSPLASCAPTRGIYEYCHPCLRFVIEKNLPFKRNCTFFIPRGASFISFQS